MNVSNCFERPETTKTVCDKLKRELFIINKSVAFGVMFKTAKDVSMKTGHTVQSILRGMMLSLKHNCSTTEIIKNYRKYV